MNYMSHKLILIVAMAASVHTARWINTVRGGENRIVLLSSLKGDISPLLEPFRIVRTRDDVTALQPGEVGIFSADTVEEAVLKTMDGIFDYRPLVHPALGQTFSLTSPHTLVTAIRLLEPDLVHSMEVQLAGYLTLEAKRRMRSGGFPPWLFSNWGSDIMLFRKLPEHSVLISEIFKAADGYWSECARDVAIAREYDYAGCVFDPLPASGSMDLMANVSRTSTRSLILIKGYHGWSGRGLHILSSLYLIAPSLRHFRIGVLFPSESTYELVEAIKARTGLAIAVEPYLPSHADAMRRMADARVVVGLGISDGISTTLLEAMSAGTFPILADTSCACEWIAAGEDGLIVDPHDTRALATAIERAAMDDALVDRASRRNRTEIGSRWSAASNGRIIEASYERLMELAASN